MLISQLYPDPTGQISIDSWTVQLWCKLTQGSYLWQIFIQALITILHFFTERSLHLWFKLFIRPENIRREAHGSSSLWYTVGKIIKHLSFPWPLRGQAAWRVPKSQLHVCWALPEQFIRLRLHHQPVGIRNFTVIYLAVGESNFICRKPISFNIRSCQLVFLYYEIWWERSCVRCFSTLWKTLANTARAFFFPELNALIFSLFNDFSKTTEDETHLWISLIAFQIPLPDSSVTDFLRSRDWKIETFCLQTGEDLVQLLTLGLTPSAFLPSKPFWQASN